MIEHDTTEERTAADHERRRYPRYAIRLPAQLLRPDGARETCTIRDYCTGGMLVQRAPHTDQVLQVGDPIELTASLLMPGGAKKVRIKARVAWQQGGAFGAEFARTVDSILDVLRGHEQLRRGTAADPAEQPSPGEVRCLAKLRHIGQGAVPPLLAELLKRVSAELVERSDRIPSDRERQQHYEDMTAFEALRRAGPDSLVQRLLQLALSERENTDQDQPPAELDQELALVETDDFERWLESSKVAAALDEQFAPQLRDLEARLAAQRTKLSGTLTEVPFSPGQFCTLLRGVAAELELGPTARHALFGVAEAVLSERLGALYGDMQARMEGLGMRPAPRRAGRGDGRPPGPPVAPTDAPPAAAPLPGAADPGVETGSPGPAVNAPAGYQAQRQAFAEELLGFVTQELGGADSLAGWLDQLQQPLAREALADESFFLNPAHPLRAILDRLGHLQALRGLGAGDPGDDALNRAVASWLQPLLSGVPNQAQYQAVAEGIEQLVDQESRKYQRNVERVVAASVGRERMRRIRNEVVDELNRRYADQLVPQIVPDMLTQGYQALLELAQLRADADTAEFRQRLDLLDAIVALLGGQAYAADSAKVSADEVLAQLHEELAATSFDPLRRHQIESRFRAELQDPAGAAERLVRMARLRCDGGETASLVPPEGISEQAWQRVLSRVDELAVGDRVQLRDAPPGRQDLRVAWIRDDRQLYTLVDQRGVRARDMVQSELANGVLRRRVEFERPDGRAVTERATDAMLTRMGEQLAHQAAHDSLTGLLSRVQFQVALQRQLGARSAGSPGDILMWIDLDQFRLVNEIHGYDTGDRLLVAVARLLEERLGTEPALAHVGGDRFGVLLPGVDTTVGQRRANAICAWVAGLHFDWQGTALPLTASVGVVSLDQVGDGPAALRAAEAAVAEAKATGGNRAYLYRADDPGISRRQESAHWVAVVDDALDHGRLRLRCQPIVPVRPESGLRRHYEVLLGIENGQGEALDIGEFIRAAEDYNRMATLDRWVTRTVVDWVASHRTRMDELHNFAVNLSGQTASDPSFVDYVQELFGRKQIEPSWISFEVTETAAVGDLGRTAGILRALKGLGCTIALDDFGSGLASYSYLKELPVDVLKIDGAFVRNIATDANDYAVVRSINDIGHFMGKRTIAEFVVDDSALRKIRTIGVDFGQGFGIARPSLLEDLVDSGGRVVPFRADPSPAG